MKMRMICLAFVTVGLASAATEADFGLLGVSSFETARLAAYCTGDGSVAPLPCDVALEFHDIQGRTLKQATLTLQPGAGGFLDFSPPPASAPSRIELDPCWKVLRGAALASLEVVDNFSLRTRILINWGDRPLARTGDLAFGLAGITAFDTGRLGAYCEGDGSVTPAPCDVTFEFHHGGRTIKQLRMTLQPDTGGFVDLNWREIGTPARRAELDPCLKVAGGAAVGSFAVIDSFTGITLTQAYPAAVVSAVQ